MKSPSYHWNQNLPSEAKPILPVVHKISQKVCFGAKIVSVFMLMQLSLIATYLTLQSGNVPAVLQAGIFLSGFIFLALAIDTREIVLAGMLAATGVALPLLALLSHNVAIEFSILAIAVIGLWVGAVVMVQERFSPATS